MRKGIFFLGSLFITGLFLTMRIYKVNQEIAYPEVVTWMPGEEVDLDKNYFYDTYEICEGYSVCVNDVQLLTCEEFVRKYGCGDSEIKKITDYCSVFPDMVYDVSITVKNKNKERQETGINFYDYNIYSKDYILSIDSYLYELANAEKKNQSPMFSLRPESELTFNLPYGVSTNSSVSYLSEDVLRKSRVYLLVSMYPIQNQILINEGEN